MEQRYFGSTKRQVVVIGQGTWYDENQDPASAIAALRLGLDRGMRHIDTAEMYGSGAAEKLVGLAIAGRRDEVFLVSKVLPQNAGRRTAIKACEKSLLRLKTNRLDCYLLHWRGRHPLEETVAAFDHLVRSGKVLYVGVSEWTASRVSYQHDVAAFPANIRHVGAIDPRVARRDALFPPRRDHDRGIHRTVNREP